MGLVRFGVGLLSLLVYVTSILVAFLVLLPVALLKRLVPAWQAPCNRVLDGVVDGWLQFNNWQQRHLTPTRISIRGDLGQLRRDEWYMLVANHQSWVDIMILVRVFTPHISPVKFFYKKELLWVPVLGQALWAVDFPMMHRHKREQIAKNPALATQDMERTQKACEAYRHHPVSMVNFLEGTRFTPAKHKVQQSPYRHLLMPKAGGLAFALAAMQGQLKTLLDTTLYYPEGRPSFWDYAQGKVARVELSFKLRPIDPNLIGDYTGDPEFRRRFQEWVNQLWREKDAELTDMAG